MKILITGDKGFVGTETKKLIESLNGPDMIVSSPYDLRWMPHGLNRKYEIVCYDLMDGFDIRDKKQFEKVIREEYPDRVLHLAAIARFDEADDDPIRAFETNYIGTKNVVDVCEKYKIPVVHASTGSCYMPIKLDPPITEDFPVMGNSVYGCVKSAAELYVRKSKSPWIVLRYAHLYGKEKRFHGLIGGFLSRIEHDLEPVLYGGKQSNDFTYIKDVARANLIALTASFDKYNQAYNIGTGEELTAEEAGKIICDAAGYTGEIQVKPQRTVDPQRFVFDVTKAKNKLGFTAEYSFKDGLEDMKEQGAF